MCCQCRTVLKYCTVGNCFSWCYSMFFTDSQQLGLSLTIVLFCTTMYSYRTSSILFYLCIFNVALEVKPQEKSFLTKWYFKIFLHWQHILGYNVIYVMLHQNYIRSIQEHHLHAGGSAGGVGTHAHIWRHCPMIQSYWKKVLNLIKMISNFEIWQDP